MRELVIKNTVTTFDACAFKLVGGRWLAIAEYIKSGESEDQAVWEQGGIFDTQEEAIAEAKKVGLARLTTLRL